MGKNVLKSILSFDFHFISSPPVCQVVREKKKYFSRIVCFFVGIWKKSGEKPREGLELFAAFWYNNTH